MSNCESCPSNGNCDNKENCMVENNPLNNVKKIIGVMSGKGGVGKSTVSALLAYKLSKKGYKVGILDADITGPSIPRLLNLKDEKAEFFGEGILPVENENGIKVMSMNFLTEYEHQPVIWRGPLVASAVKQFWTDVLWGDVDYLIVDMPPGTGDVPLTVMQSIPISGIVMVSVPQDMVSMIVSKAVNMVRQMKIKVLGVVENMSYIICPECKNRIKLFDDEGTEAFIYAMNLNVLGELPMCKELTDVSRDGIKPLSDNLDTLINGFVENMLKAMETK